jgi:hypothetical protein
VPIAGNAEWPMPDARRRVTWRAQGETQRDVATRSAIGRSNRAPTPEGSRDGSLRQAIRELAQLVR